MANLTDLAVFLSTGRCIVWVGAGPSVEVGLPNWTELANTVLEECRRRQRAGFASIEDRYRKRQFPEMFDRVSITYGREFLHEVCSRALEDTGQIGSIYRDIVDLDCLSYFTTNYDTVLERHLNTSGRAVQKYLNSDADLRTIDIDTTPALVKLHGEFLDSQSVVLTKSDYQNWYQSGPKEAFQTFLKSHMARDRILFIGYSLNDPELMAIQERLAVNLRRSVSSMVLLPNASGEDVDSWSTYYNVDVLSYRAIAGDHSELHSILSTTSKVLALGEVAPQRETTHDLKTLQALYLWHRFSPSRAGRSTS